MYLLGYDIGSSSVKASLVNAETGKCVSSAFFPKTEAAIMAARPGCPLGGVVVAHGVAVDDLIGGLTEDIDVLLAHLLADLHIGTVHGAQRQRTVQHELHVAGAGGLLGGKADLFRQVTGRDELFGGGCKG